MTRTPPSRGRHEGGATSIVVFEENKGTISSTYLGRSILRIRIRMAANAAKPFATNARQVNYGGKYLHIFPGIEFPILCKLLVLKHDIIRMPDGELADRSKPLQDWFGFVRDQS